MGRSGLVEPSLALRAACPLPKTIARSSSASGARPGRRGRGGGCPGLQRRARSIGRLIDVARSQPRWSRRANCIARQRPVRRPCNSGRLRPAQRRGHQRLGCGAGFDRRPGGGANRFTGREEPAVAVVDVAPAGQPRPAEKPPAGARRLWLGLPGRARIGMASGVGRHEPGACVRRSMPAPACDRATPSMAVGATPPCVWCRAASSSPPITAASAPSPTGPATVCEASRSVFHSSHWSPCSVRSLATCNSRSRRPSMRGSVHARGRDHQRQTPLQCGGARSNRKKCSAARRGDASALPRRGQQQDRGSRRTGQFVFIDREGVQFGKSLTGHR